MTLTDDQKLALEKLHIWQKKPYKQFITLGGYAGTGKTALLTKFRQKLSTNKPKFKVAFGAFTGKAAQVLKSYLGSEKTIFKQDKVGTIHSLIYQAIDDAHGRVIGWKKRDSLKFDLIIIDEASMLSQQIWQDLLSFNLPIIAAGDHGQLPPIEGNFNLMANLDLTLTQIHRQALESPIIKLSIMARQDGFIPVGEYSLQVKKISRRDPDINAIVAELLSEYNKDTLFLVGMNKTRLQLNQEIRTSQEILSVSPQVGDRVICLKNNWQKGIANGLLGTIENIKKAKPKMGVMHWYEAEIMMDDGTWYEGQISAHQFGEAEPVKLVPGLKWFEIGDLFDFGYTLTVHKAQGSQARRVILFEERNRHQSDEDWRRWLYTGVTRAMEELIIIGD